MYWPAPTFSVTALDRPDEPIVAKSCTGCWSGVRGGEGDDLGSPDHQHVFVPVRHQTTPTHPSTFRPPPSDAPHLCVPAVSPRQILRRINDEIEARRSEGQDLPPPPKTAIAGPEYFGLNMPEVICIITPTPMGQSEHYSLSLSLSLSLLAQRVIASHSPTDCSSGG